MREILIWLIILMPVIYICVLAVKEGVAAHKLLQKLHPPRIECSAVKGIAYVSVYEESSGRSFRPSGYKKYTFIYNRKGKWIYKSEKTGLYILLYLLPIIIISVSFIYHLGIIYVFDNIYVHIALILIWGALVYGLYELEPYKARKELEFFLSMNPHLNVKREAKGEKKVKVEKKVKDKKDITDNSQMNEDRKYDLLANSIKSVLRILVFLFWLGILCLILIPFMISGIILYSLLSETESLLQSAFACGTSGIMVLVAGVILYGWIYMRKSLMGDHSYFVPIGIAGKIKKYGPKYVLARLNDKRNNVILLKSIQGQVRIYGSGDTHVLELQTGKKNDLKVFHMIHKDIDSIIPDTDDNPTVIENKWYEKFPVRKNWLVNEEAIGAFLLKLYMSKDIQEAMEGFSFEDNTTEINRLIEEDAYIVPEIPVDWPVGGINSNIGQAWMRRKEERLQRSLKLMEKL